jgi:hypothetical protein
VATHPDILRPEAGRFAYRDPKEEFKEALVLTSAKERR